MPRFRPTSITVIAILHLVGGGLGLMGGVCGGAVQLVKASQAAPAAPAPPPAPGAMPNQADMEARMEAYYESTIPSYQLHKWGSLAFDLLLDVMLVTAGIGLLGMHPWARYLSLVYAVLSILYHIYNLIYMLGFFLPASSEFFERELAGMPGPPAFFAAMKAALYAGAFVNAAFIAYPIVVLCLLLRPSMNVAFSAEGLPPPGRRDRDEDREDYYDPPRRDRDRDRDEGRWGDEDDERFRR
jgi:hypothetical protein